MALTATTLSGAKATNDVVIGLTSATGIASKMLALVDGEWMRITGVALSPTVGVVPGYYGTTAGPHGILAPVIFGNAIDFVSVGVTPGWVLTSASFGVDGAITGPGGTGTVPVSNTIVYLTKATAGAYTIALPAKDQQNSITFISTTAAAHVVTMTGNPAANDVATFTAAIGSSFTIKGDNAAWAIVSTGNVTVA
jgi:hypothetical protein